GAGALDVNVAMVACEQGIAGLEFLTGIPGTIGGAVRMNGGAYGSDMAQVLAEAEIVTREGEVLRLINDQLGFVYRNSALPEGAVVTRAWLQGRPGDKVAIVTRMAEINAAREATQPIRARTGGSTFKNPAGGPKAWELIDRAGCRGLAMGGAQVSEKHCNFLINTGSATASDLEGLGEEVIARVREATGVTLEWEIKRIGERV
ncbi:MAG: UDP-N-acetylmuramate dehydrogenase, partial [Proteobacteria bacterium]|nr:UDP-N-acetylmuramate dehydrogenase [Pseudomonadota bacterium]